MSNPIRHSDLRVCVVLCWGGETLAPRCFAILPRHIVVFVRIPGCSSACVFARCFNKSPLIFRSFNFPLLFVISRRYLWYHDENSADSLLSNNRHNIRKPANLQLISTPKFSQMLEVFYQARKNLIIDNFRRNPLHNLTQIL